MNQWRSHSLLLIGLVLLLLLIRLVLVLLRLRTVIVLVNHAVRRGVIASTVERR